MFQPFSCCRVELLCHLLITLECNIMCYNGLEYTNHSTNRQPPQHSAIASLCTFLYVYHSAWRHLLTSDAQTLLPSTSWLTSNVKFSPLPNTASSPLASLCTFPHLQVYTLPQPPFSPTTKLTSIIGARFSSIFMHNWSLFQDSGVHSTLERDWETERERKFELHTKPLFFPPAFVSSVFSRFLRREKVSEVQGRRWRIFIEGIIVILFYFTFSPIWFSLQKQHPFVAKK